jgi:rsbT co-antagonist protein RsbR
MNDLASWLMKIDVTDDDARRRGQMIVTLAVSMLALALVAIPLTLIGPTPGSGLGVLTGGLVIYTLVLVIVRRGYVTVAGVLLIATVLATLFVTMLTSSDSLIGVYLLVLPLLVAGLALRPVQIWFVLAITLLGLWLMALLMPESALANRANGMTIITAVLLLIVATLLSFIGGRATHKALSTASKARSAAEEAAAALERSNVDLEQRVSERTSALTDALAEVEARATEQARLLAENDAQRATIRELSVPVLPVNKHALVMPLVGALDTTRLAMIQERALSAIEEESAHLLLLDITGVPIVDSQVAQGLRGVVQAARLLGAEVVLVGVRPEVAQTAVGLGLDLRGMRAFSDLRSALAATAQPAQARRPEPVAA